MKFAPTYIAFVSYQSVVIW